MAHACVGARPSVGRRLQLRVPFILRDPSLPAAARRPVYDGVVELGWPDGTLDKTLFRELHTRSVRALVALPDNQHALAGANDIRLFNVYDGAVLRTFKHHTDEVSCLALLPDGLRFVSGSGDTTARIVYHGLAPQA